MGIRETADEGLLDDPAQLSAPSDGLDVIAGELGAAKQPHSPVIADEAHDSGGRDRHGGARKELVRSNRTLRSSAGK